MINFTLVHKELKEFFADLRLCLPSILMCIIVPCLAVGLLSLLYSLYSSSLYLKAINKLYFLTFLFVSSFPLSLTIPIALESFVGEKERKTFEILLVLPLTEGEIYLSKLFSAFFIPALLGSFSLILFSVLAYVYNLNFIPLQFVFIIFSLLILKSILLVSASSVISIGTSTIRSANVAASLVILPGTLLLGIESYLLYTGNVILLSGYIMVLFFYGLLFLRLGIISFTREGQMIFKDEIIYLKNILKKNISIRNISKKSIFFIILFFLSGMFVSFIYIRNHHIIFDIFNSNYHQSKLDLFKVILYHNLKVYVIIAPLSLISFGIIPGLSAFITGIITMFLLSNTLSPYQISHLSFITIFPKNLLFLFIEIPIYLFLMIICFETGTKVFNKINPGFIANSIPLLKKYYIWLMYLLPLIIFSAYLEVLF